VNALVEVGLVLDWDLTEPTERFTDGFRKAGGQLQLRLHHIASQMSALVFEEFGTAPVAIAGYTDEETAVSVGWLVLLLEVARSVRSRP
jgi:hypothetical protein